MSELKAINAYQLTINAEEAEVYIHNNEFGCGGVIVECYINDDVDKVIAELKALKAQAEDDCAYWKSKAQRERHSNYKRCLAMAKWCELGIAYWDDDEQEGGWEYIKLRHCIRWQKRWLELAEKFKPNKSIAQ